MTASLEGLVAKYEAAAEKFTLTSISGVLADLQSLLATPAPGVDDTATFGTTGVTWAAEYYDARPSVPFADHERALAAAKAEGVREERGKVPTSVISAAQTARALAQMSLTAMENGRGHYSHSEAAPHRNIVAQIDAWLTDREATT